MLDQVKCSLFILGFYIDVNCKCIYLILIFCILKICIIAKLWNLGSGNKDILYYIIIIIIIIIGLKYPISAILKHVYNHKSKTI